MSDTSGPTFATAPDKNALETGSTFTPRFDRDGLIPAIITDSDTRQVLMFAWMNARALSLTFETGCAHFWSRSRKKLWKKGEESGNILQVQTITTDCDQDVLCLQVKIEGNGVACHTNRRTCFYREIQVAPANVTSSQLTFIDTK